MSNYQVPSVRNEKFVHLNTHQEFNDTNEEIPTS